MALLPISITKSRHLCLNPRLWVTVLGETIATWGPKIVQLIENPAQVLITRGSAIRVSGWKIPAQEKAVNGVINTTNLLTIDGVSLTVIG